MDSLKSTEVRLSSVTGLFNTLVETSVYFASIFLLTRIWIPTNTLNSMKELDPFLLLLKVIQLQKILCLCISTV